MCCNNGGTVETLLSEEAPPAKKLCSGGSTAVFSFDTVGGKKKSHRASSVHWLPVSCVSNQSSVCRHGSHLNPPRVLA